jgi:soluble lytic murein transglycosylase
MDLKTRRLSRLLASAALLALPSAGAGAVDWLAPHLTAPAGVAHFVMTPEAGPARPQETAASTEAGQASTPPAPVAPFAIQAPSSPAAPAAPTGADPSSAPPALRQAAPASPAAEPALPPGAAAASPGAAEPALPPRATAASPAAEPALQPRATAASPAAEPAPRTDPASRQAGGEPGVPAVDIETLRQAIAAVRKGDVAEADALRQRLPDPAALAILDWVALRAGVAMTFERIAGFQSAHPDWPMTALIRRRAEEALLANRKSPAVVRAYFAKDAPLSGSGKLALAFALKADGEEEAARPLVRSAWREDSFGRDLESRVLDAFPDVLTSADHRFRMERFLFRESWVSALRAAAYAGDGYALLAKARMAAHAGGKKAEKALAAVPEHLRSDPSYRFSRAQLLRRQEKFDEAAKVIADVTQDPALLVDGDEWWEERRILARKLLDRGEAALAYRIAGRHGAESDAQRIEAEFHAGWIALRFLHDPAAARQHFAEAARVAATPISIARAAYWQGRAAEAAGLSEEAKPHYERAAAHPIAYYGQLARDKLGAPPVELRRPAGLDESARSAFRNLRAVQALKLLHAAGADDLALSLYADLAQKLASPGELDALGALAAEHGNARAVLIVGKSAVQRGFPLDAHAYPVFGVPDFPTVGDPVEEAMVYAITRQESAFNAKALSTAGARGLMQLMPATAQRTAKRFKVDFDVKRLVDDPAYNAKIGAAHLGELMEDWRGSHILAFASYNAGGGNVSKWIKAYGDPRSPGVDAVDWVERIPFSETRNYVQRVLENLKVYRHRLADRKLEDRKIAERAPSDGAGRGGPSAEATLAGNP